MLVCRLAWLVVFAALVAAAGCVGGQSGTESGGGTKLFPDPSANINNAAGTCACSLSEMPAVAVRARVVQVERDAIRLRVRTVLGEGPTEPLLRFAPGDEIGGEWAEPGCEPAVVVQAGDDVAALHVPGSQISYECPERRACASARCDSLRAGDPRLATCESDCQRETKSQCSTHAAEALLHGRVLIARWGAELGLPLARGGDRVGELRVSADELPQLLDAESCQKRVAAVLPPEEFSDAGIGLGLPDDSTLGSAADD